MSVTTLACLVIRAHVGQRYTAPRYAKGECALPLQAVFDGLTPCLTAPGGKSRLLVVLDGHLPEKCTNCCA
jgi:hypothetical protein